MMKKYLILLLTALLFTGCSQSNDSEASTPAETTPPAEVETESLPPPTQAPFPEADPNAVTFDDGNFSFATIISDDLTAAKGKLSVETVDGNKMLKFTDLSTTEKTLGSNVQKIQLSVSRLLRADQLETVNSIAFDMYAEAKGDLFVDDNGNNLTVPGWIGGGGGTTCLDGRWHGFEDFYASDINEYALKRSDACHVVFKFSVEDAGNKWDSSMDEVNLLIMRWGMQNLSDMYIDNITFYDEEGNAIPLNPSEPDADASDQDLSEEDGADADAEVDADAEADDQA